MKTDLTDLPCCLWQWPNLKRPREQQTLAGFPWFTISLIHKKSSQSKSESCMGCLAWHSFLKHFLNVREDSCEGRAFHIITQYFHLVRWGAGFSCPLVGRGGSARAFLSCASPHIISALCYPNLNNILCTCSPLLIDSPPSLSNQL